MTTSAFNSFSLPSHEDWGNREQAKVIDYLVDENRVLKEQLERRRLRLGDDQRHRLAARGEALGRKLQDQIATIVTPDTILRWQHRLIAAKWTCPSKRWAAPGIMKEIRSLIVRMATNNPSWGYCRIQAALKHVGHSVARSTIAKTLKEHGIKSSPKRPTSWRSFIKSHADLIARADFFTTEVWTARGLVTHDTLFVIDIATRVVHIAGTTTNPDSPFMAQVARNLSDCVAGFPQGKRLLILDRDGKFTTEFKRILEDAAVRMLLTPYQAPNMNAFAERWIRSIKAECLRKMILFGSSSLERVIRNYVDHYHEERSHQGLGNELIRGDAVSKVGDVKVSQRLGGLLQYYHRHAA